MFSVLPINPILMDKNVPLVSSLSIGINKFVNASAVHMVGYIIRTLINVNAKRINSGQVIAAYNVIILNILI